MDRIDALRAALAGTVVVDAQGRPRRVYHGTPYAFDTFDPGCIGPTNFFGPGFYFTVDPSVAGGFACVGAGRIPITLLAAQSARSAQEILARILDDRDADALPNPGHPFRRPENFARLTPATTWIEERWSEDGPPSYLLRYAPRGVPTPNVRPAYLALTRPLVMEAAVDPRLQRALSFVARVRVAPLGGVITNGDAWNALETLFGGRPQSPLFSSGRQARINQFIAALGYDGIAHVGGGVVDPGGVRHQDYAVFRPEQIHSGFAATPEQIGAVSPPKQ